MTLTSHIQGADLGAKVTLYQLDLSMFGLGVEYLTPTTDGEGGAISFGGQSYSPHPIKAQGFETTTNGPLPRPSIEVGNIDNSFTVLVEQNDDLQGAILRRIRTYSRYLDNGAEPDGGSHLPIDVYLLSQKTKDTQDLIGWQLVSIMDQEGVELPGRPIIRDYCGHDTRRWNGSSFDYTNATCPYTGDPKDANGDACAPEDEVFSKRLGTCCQARFGTNAVLPTRAFPGVARMKSR